MTAVNLIRAGLLEQHQCRAFFTTRDGGVSRPPYDTLNLGFHVGDDDGATAENLRRVAAAGGLTPDVVHFATQVHGRDLAGVTAATPPGRVGLVDGMYTTIPGRMLMVRTADCLPLLLLDPHRRLIAAVHAGRKGTFLNIGGAAVAQLVAAGSTPGDLLAAIGPAAGKCCYAVNDAAITELRARRPHDAGAFIGQSADGQPTIDLCGLNRQQLREAGLPDAQIALHHACTICDRRFFSYRRDGITGRQAGIICLT